MGNGIDIVDAATKCLVPVGWLRADVDVDRIIGVLLQGFPGAVDTREPLVSLKYRGRLVVVERKELKVVRWNRGGHVDVVGSAAIEEVAIRIQTRLEPVPRSSDESADVQLVNSGLVEVPGHVAVAGVDIPVLEVIADGALGGPSEV